MGIVAVTRCVATSMTERSPPFSLVTKRRPADPAAGPDAGAGAAGCADGGSDWVQPAARTATMTTTDEMNFMEEIVILTKNSYTIQSWLRYRASGYDHNHSALHHPAFRIVFSRFIRR